MSPDLGVRDANVKTSRCPRLNVDWRLMWLFLVGLSAWLGVNGTFVESWKLKSSLPEGADLMRNLSLLTQFANVIPLSIWLGFQAVRSRSGSRSRSRSSSQASSESDPGTTSPQQQDVDPVAPGGSDSGESESSEERKKALRARSQQVIATLQGVLAGCMWLTFMWSKWTVSLGGKQYSGGLYLGYFLFATCGCLSNFVFWPYVGLLYSKDEVHERNETNLHSSTVNDNGSPGNVDSSTVQQVEDASGGGVSLRTSGTSGLTSRHAPEEISHSTSPSRPSGSESQSTVSPTPLLADAESGGNGSDRASKSNDVDRGISWLAAGENAGTLCVSLLSVIQHTSKLQPSFFFLGMAAIACVSIAAATVLAHQSGGNSGSRHSSSDSDVAEAVSNTAAVRLSSLSSQQRTELSRGQASSSSNVVGGDTVVSPHNIAVVNAGSSVSVSPEASSSPKYGLNSYEHEAEQSRKTRTGLAARIGFLWLLFFECGFQAGLFPVLTARACDNLQELRDQSFQNVDNQMWNEHGRMIYDVNSSTHQPVRNTGAASSEKPTQVTAPLQSSRSNFLGRPGPASVIPEAVAAESFPASSSGAPPASNSSGEEKKKKKSSNRPYFYAVTLPGFFSPLAALIAGYGRFQKGLVFWTANLAWIFAGLLTCYVAFGLSSPPPVPSSEVDRPNHGALLNSDEDLDHGPSAVSTFLLWGFVVVNAFGQVCLAYAKPALMVRLRAGGAPLDSEESRRSWNSTEPSNARRSSNADNVTSLTSSGSSADQVIITQDASRTTASELEKVPNQDPDQNFWLSVAGGTIQAGSLVGSLVFFFL